MGLRRGPGIIIPWLSVAGMLALGYILGAAVVHFQLPTSEYLEDAFTGGEAWFARKSARETPTPVAGGPISIDVDKPGRACDGFTLYTTNVGAQAALVDMGGRVVHRWEAPFSRVWPRPAHVREPVADDKVYFFGCHLYPNGDLLAVFHGSGDTPYGYGLAKLDRDSRVLWTYSANVHHAVDVGDDGTIYALTHRVVRKMPQGLEFFPTPALVDQLVLLSPEGRELKTIPLLEAFRDSAYGLVLPSRTRDVTTTWDVLHANFVEVLRPSLAPHFPLFRAGQVLVSVRELDTLAVIDTERGSVAWATRGPWRGQHDPHFLDNGRLLVFDNDGSARGSRVLEYDPLTQACPWSYSGEGGLPFITEIQGRCQRLPNGNTLVVDSKAGVLLEVTPDKELVWSCSCKARVPWARRYGADELTFLEGGTRARP
jgi:hypothetical protein